MHGRQSPVARRPPTADPGGAGAGQRPRSPLLAAVGRPAVAALAVLLLTYVLLWAPLLPAAADDFGIAGVFSTDEPLSGRIVRTMLDERTLSPGHFFAYGALYHEVTALALAPFVPAGIGERGTLIGLRAVAQAGGVATLALTYALGARLYGVRAGLLAALLVACSTELAAWSVTAHPDTLQLALLTASLLAVCAVRERPSRGRIALAALLAGLAFATKYAGLLLLPVLGLAVVAARVDGGAAGRGGGNEERERAHAPPPTVGLLRQLAADAAMIGAAFALAFALTNPYALIEWRRFITQARAEIAHVREGHVTVAADPPLRWLGLVAARSFAGPAVVAAAAVSWVVALARGRERAYGRRRPATGSHPAPRSPLDAPRLAAMADGPALVGLWGFGYLAYLVAFVGLQAPRYALPVLPALAVLAAGGVERWAMRRPAWSRAAGATLLVVTLAGAVLPLADLHRDRLSRPARLADDPRVAAGRWLQAHLDPQAAMLSDAYVYLPPSLRRATTTFGLTEAQLSALRPVAVVVNDDIRGRFADPGGGAHYVDGPAAYAERHDAYRRLEDGALGCYRLAASFGTVRVFADREALATGAHTGCGAAAR